MQLSSSSKIIVDKLTNIENIISNTEKYWAHKDGHPNVETMQEHSELVLKYAKEIINEQKIDLVLDKLVMHISGDNKELAEFIKLLFIASIAYHDLGKINPNFQVDKMKNDQFDNNDLSIGSQHSVLSAYLFLHHFAEYINSAIFEKEEKILLFGIVYLFCYPIAKHHSPFIGIDIHFSNELFEELFSFLNDCGIKLPIKASKNILKAKESWIKNIDESKKFALFSLLKLSYSLLTACDYYATNEYMANMKVDDFGILNDKLKEKIVINFKTKQAYNKDLFDSLEEFEKKPFSELQYKSRDNLNFLRQKLTAEVIGNLRKNPDNPWYYIEAPTGAGKTNLSLACISELLQIDKTLNKVFYVFPFTTLITQTFQGIQETIGLDNSEMIQLHSKAGFHKKEEQKDGLYGNEKHLYLNNLFVNYPFCVTSHVRFFDILKGNSKNTNYLHHRLCNSIVVIDELQTYNPKHWDKILFFIENYARLFNMRFIIMSATLPKIDALSDTAKGQFVSLTPNKHQYFMNPNFAGRIEFDFSLLDKKRPDKETKESYLGDLSVFMKNKADEYFRKHGKARVLIEFITKNTASQFFNIVQNEHNFEGFKLFIISGDILDPQRKIIIKELKDEKYDKVVVVSTQVVEAGVDIDMDLGFKDRSLLDSDEQLAGRINRNASKEDCKVFLFDCDSAKTIYGKDERYKHQQKDKEIYFGFKEILRNKTFDKLYEKVFEDAKKEDWTDGGKLDAYLNNFKILNFQNISKEFMLIDENDSEQLYIPLDIEIRKEFDLEFLKQAKVLTDDESKVSGEKLFEKYISIVSNRDSDFVLKQIELKKLTGLMSQFTISVYPNILKELGSFLDPSKEEYGYKYLLGWDNNCYSLEKGFNMENIKTNVFL